MKLGMKNLTYNNTKSESDIFVENRFLEYFAADLVTFLVLVIGKTQCISERLLLDVVYNFRTDFSENYCSM